MFRGKRRPAYTSLVKPSFHGPPWLTVLPQNHLKCVHLSNLRSSSHLQEEEEEEEEYEKSRFQPPIISSSSISPWYIRLHLKYSNPSHSCNPQPRHENHNSLTYTTAALLKSNDASPNPHLLPPHNHLPHLRPNNPRPPPPRHRHLQTRHLQTPRRRRF